jgi:3-oxoadipate enol-lactonase
MTVSLATTAPRDRLVAALVRQLARHMDVVTHWPGYPMAVRALIETEAVIGSLVEGQARLLARVMGTTTEAEQRERRELEARRLLRQNGGGASRPDAGREPVVFWHEAGVGPPLLLLNGWTASGLIWPRDWRCRLERRFRVVRVDNRGTGWSRTAPAPFTIADMARDAADVLATLGLDRATVAGFSMGGMVAQELAIRRPDLVERLVLVATRPPAPAHVSPAPDVLERQLGNLLESPDPAEPLEEFYRRRWLPHCSAEFLARRPECFEELLSQIIERPPPRRAVVNQVRAIAAWSGAHRLRGLRMPTTIAHGDADQLMPVGNGRRLSRLIAGARYVELPGVGHLVPLECPDILAEVIEGGTS